MVPGGLFILLSYILLLFAMAGLTMVWMAKSTKLYMLPDWPTFTNPFFKIIVRDFSDGKFNAGNLVTWNVNATPELANYLWMILMIPAIFLLNFWNRRIVLGKDTKEL